jgi:hypothetical protein
MRSRFPIILFASLLTASAASVGVAGWIANGRGNVEVAVVAKHPTDAQVLYAGTEQGLHVSRDGGSSWTLATASGLLVTTIATSSSTGTVYATTAHGTFLRSHDAGASWSTSQPPFGHVFRLAVDTLGIVCASTIGPNAIGSEIWRTVDGGEAWIRSDTGIGPLKQIVLDLLAPNLAGPLYAATNHGILRSIDSGVSWFRASDIRAVDLDSDDIGNLYAVDVDGRVALSTDGETWTPLEGGVTLPHDVSVVAAAPSGHTVWTGGNDRLFVWAGPVGWVDIGVPVEGSVIHDLLPMSDHSVLVATDRGLFRSIPGGGWDDLTNELFDQAIRSPRVVAPR